ncbi:putative 20S cyclosome subunit [Coniochaeta ligniaria NRRL 30616]|uniref:Putative 20S cyclosome subunit n=1 Tax=Coniochaeta ligniaria NRRL 30616 TaxID=1408157 RepID=A0A1J7J019_9PEZI|nr:putative 20S cyclosome subunit [Coniochaeta ligniaria NRRL 30616]
MASVNSLGVHLPSGLPFAIESDILPPDPPASSYSWEYFVDTINGQDCEDELLVTNTCVVWSRGGSMRRIFSFNLENETITQALLTYFPTSEGSEGQPHTDPGQRSTKTNTKNNRFEGLSRALVVFLKTQAHIHFLSGTSYVVHMPFEVESACAAPCGVIIQRKLKADNLAPVSLKFPRVPPNSFVSSQPAVLTPRDNSSQTMAFSTEGLGKPKTLPLRLSSTLETMWQPTLESSDSHWPRLVCLTDPLQELGLVVTHQDKLKVPGAGRMKSPFLDPAEEILHIESIKLPSDGMTSQEDSVTVAVTVNRASSMYTVWRMAYIQNEDMFTGSRKKPARRDSTRRRSSMPPGLTSGSTTPVPPKARESFGAPLPGKKPRKSANAEKALDTALSSLDPEKGGDIIRRTSRRVSSLLARADLSASQDRVAFADQPMVPGHGGRRVESHGSQRGRGSANFGGVSLSGTFNQNLNSLAEAPVDNLLDELRAGGDFEGFHTMGLDDHDFDGLAREVLMTKLHSVPMDNANVRYSLSTRPARTQCRVFVLLGSPSTTDEQGRTQLVVGIQDPVDKRLQLLLFYVQKSDGGDTPARPDHKSRTVPGDGYSVTWGHLRKAQGVVDSCKLVDGDQSMILILSEDKSGQLLYREDIDSLDFSGEYADEDANSKRLVGFGGSGIDITGLANPQSHGIVDIQDREGAFHRVRIQLQPTSVHVRKILDACKSVLPASQSEKMLSTWWHIMQWRESTAPHSRDLEWSSLVILLFSSFLALKKGLDTQSVWKGLQTPNRPFDEMQAYETPISGPCPPWMHNKGWQWLLDEDIVDVTNDATSTASSGAQLISAHITLANEFLLSPRGVSAFGPQGTLPTSLARSSGSRKTAAWCIMMSLHLLLEEQRLNILTSEDVPQSDMYLRVVLAQIARWLGWREYAAMYDIGMQTDLPLSSAISLQGVSPILEPPSNYCVYDWIQSGLSSDTTAPFLTLADIYTTATQDTTKENVRTRLWDSVTPRTLMFAKLFQHLKPARTGREMVEVMFDCGFTPQILETLPEAILVPLQDAIFMCQSEPPTAWPSALLELINRTDVSSMFKPRNHVRAANVLASSHHAAWDVQLLCQSVDDLATTGHDEGEATERQAVVQALFKEDRRLNEAQNLLSSQKPRIVKLDARPEWSESEYLEKQKELATIVATGSLAIPAGRGLLYYALRYPILTQRFHIGGFNLSCIFKPSNVTVGVDKSLFTEEKINWAFFHQGVAGGLAISPHAKGIDTSWILYNKTSQDLSNRHAGFLLALGLNGHLKSVAKWVAFKYLTPKHTMTSIGLLLGLAASYLGTMDSLITRLLSVHVTRMLPRGAAELNLSKLTQTTGIMGIGLLYCNSQHRRMSEIMLSEIEHVDDEDEENPLRDESYRLAAGFALGFINLGKGADLKGLYDMRLTEKLLTVATATKKVELVHVLDRSAAGAVMAIALIFMKSDDHIVARKIDIPDSVLQFDYIRPDILLLRTLAKNLVMWSKIEPRFEWIKASLPRDYRWRYQLKNVTKLQSKDLPFFSILAGTCFAIALRFAGSANPKVRDLLVHYLDEFMRIVRLPSRSFDAELARGNARMCMDLLALSCATVMAGTGDLVVLRRLRSLHGRDDTSTTYGSHLAAHLAIGALFLGCGTATFGTSNLAIASLLVAFYPLFPATVQDNRSHLQAFRHFWVLATEPRCLVTKDVVTGQPVSVPIIIRLKQTSPTATSATTSTFRRQTPCLLPPLDDVISVRTDAGGLGYWDVAIDFATRPELASAFHQNQSLYLRRRPALERPFPATVRALGRRGNIPLAEGQSEAVVADPMEWIFSLEALRGLTHAERTLVLADGLDGWSRDRLLGLRVLFAWADRRGLLRREVGKLVGEGGVRRDKGKEKKVEGKKGRRKGEDESVARDDADDGAVGNGLNGDAWWMRDSVVDMLKGQAWLAGSDD